MSEIVLRFVHISDTHISHDPDYAPWSPRHAKLAAEKLVEQVNNLPFTPDFVLHTGDVAYDPQAEAYELARDILGQIKYPVHYLAGNHDSAALLQSVFLRRDSVQPTWHYQFESNGVQVVCLDSTGPAEIPSGTVSAEQLDWLREICNANDPRPLVIGVHHNAIPSGIPWLDTFMRMANGEDLHAALLPARDRLRGVFYGHIHQPTQTMRDGILYCSAASAWYQLHSWPDQTETVQEMDAEPGFNVVTVTDKHVHIRHHRYAIMS